MTLEYWTRYGGNGGVSIRDSTRAKFAVGTDWVADKTPFHNGYEIQIISGHDSENIRLEASIFLRAAKKGSQNENDWNRMEIRSPDSMMTVFIKSQKVTPPTRRGPKFD